MLCGLEKFLLTADKDQLEDMEQESPESFSSLRRLYQSANSLSLTFLLGKVLSALVISFLSVIFFESIQDSAWVTATLTFVLLLFAIGLLPLLFYSKMEARLPQLLRLTNPLLVFFINLTNGFVAKKEVRATENLSVAEIQKALPDEEVQPLSAADVNLYRQIARFDRLKIRQVMRPKSELQGIKSNYNFKEVLQKIKTSQFSRLPVYEGNWNKTLGIIHCKDLLPYTEDETMNWKDKIRPILYVQERDNAQQILKKFQKSKNHMALVLSSSKRLVGLVTLEDITEEIIGEIEDE
jgi:CBS domain containing-hemolysin-like protein